MANRLLTREEFTAMCARFDKEVIQPAIIKMAQEKNKKQLARITES